MADIQKLKKKDKMVTEIRERRKAKAVWISTKPV